MVNYWVAPGISVIPEEDDVNKYEEKLKRVAQTVCSYYGFTIDELKEKDRHRSKVVARQMAYYFQQRMAKNARYNDSSFRTGTLDIGRFWDRNHATVIYGLKTMDNLLDSRFGDKNVINESKDLKKILNWQVGIKV